MKKRSILAAVCLCAALLVTASAVGMRATQKSADLRFNGTTAICLTTITTDKTSDVISATMKLTQGSTTVASWTANGNNEVSLTKTAAVSSGKTYTLTVTYTINGISQPTMSVTRTNS